MSNTMKRPNQITFDGSHYGKSGDIWEDITSTIKILMRNDYVCTIQCYEPSFQIYVIEFDYADDALAEVKPHWLTPEQYEKAVAEKEEEDGKVY